MTYAFDPDGPDQWLILETPYGPFLFKLGHPTLDEIPDLLFRARAAAGFPPNATGAPDNDGYCHMLTPGEPHQTLLDRAIVFDIDDLANVDPEAVELQREAQENAHKVRALEAARAALAALDPETRDALLAGL